MAILGLLVQQSDTTGGLGTRLAELFPRAQWHRNTVHKTMPMTVEDWARRGILPSVKIGRRRLYIRQKVEAVLLEQVASDAQ